MVWWEGVGRRFGGGDGEGGTLSGLCLQDKCTCMSMSLPYTQGCEGVVVVYLSYYIWGSI